MFYWDQPFPVGWDFSCSDSLRKERILIGLVDQLFLTSSELELESSIGNFNKLTKTSVSIGYSCSGLPIFPTTFSWKAVTAK